MELTIPSSRSRERLTIAMTAHDQFDAEWKADLVTESLTATTGFSADASQWEDLLAFLSDLATNWKGWDGEKRWSPMEGGVLLAASHDGLGHVELWVTLTPGPVVDNDWIARAPLQLESGALDDLPQRS